MLGFKICFLLNPEFTQSCLMVIWYDLLINYWTLTYFYQWLASIYMILLSTLVFKLLAFCLLISSYLVHLLIFWIFEMYLNFYSHCRRYHTIWWCAKSRKEQDGASSLEWNVQSSWWRDEGYSLTLGIWDACLLISD